MFIQTTRLIKITALPHFLEDQSDIAEGHFVWAYTIQIENQGDETVQLLNRRWHITDAEGQEQHVEGPGFVGEQPLLKPGQSYQYTSGTVLQTSSGIMCGSYEMENQETGEHFDVVIPTFNPTTLDRAVASAAPFRMQTAAPSGLLPHPHPSCPPWRDMGVTSWTVEEAWGDPLLEGQVPAGATGHGREWAIEVSGHELRVARMLEPTRHIASVGGDWSLTDRLALFLDGKVLRGPVPASPGEANPGPYWTRWLAEKFGRRQASAQQQELDLPGEWQEVATWLAVGVHPGNVGARKALSGHDPRDLAPNSPEVLLALSLHPNP